MHNPTIPLKLDNIFNSPAISGMDGGIGLEITRSLISDAIKRIHADGVNRVFTHGSYPQMPNIDCLKANKPQFWQFGAIFEDEGTIKGTYGVHTSIFIDQLGLRAPEDPNELAHIGTATTKRLQAISAMAGSTWGLATRDLRQIYSACIAPIALYACSAWVAPNQRGSKGRYNRQMRLLDSIQKNAAKAISGGFRTVAKDAFNAELQLMPMRHRAELLTATSMARIASSPIYPHIIGKRAHHHRRNQAWRSPLDLAEESFLLTTGIDPQDLEIPLGGNPRLYI